MKRILSLILILSLCLSLCACGKKEEEAPAPAVPEPAETVTPVQMRSYRSYEINAENWNMFFEIAEIPLYILTSTEIISEVCQTYCVVLKDEYLPYLNPEGDYSVRFELSFDLYCETLEIDTAHFTYRHTDDMLYAGNATKSAIFDRSALPKSAYGSDYNARVGYANAFFSGWAVMQPESKAWAGFYIDLSSVQMLSASGKIELAV